MNLRDFVMFLFLDFSMQWKTLLAVIVAISLLAGLCCETAYGSGRSAVVELCEVCQEGAKTRVDIRQECSVIYCEVSQEPCPIYDAVRKSHRCWWHAYREIKLKPVEAVSEYNHRVCDFYGWEYEPGKENHRFGEED